MNMVRHDDKGQALAVAEFMLAMNLVGYGSSCGLRTKYSPPLVAVHRNQVDSSGFGIPSFAKVLTVKSRHVKNMRR